MRTLLIAVLCLGGGVAMAEPIVTNQDNKPYSLQMDCKHLSQGQSIYPDVTVKLDEFKIASNCTANIYPEENPFDKNGSYDKKKRFSSAKLKKDSECVIKNRRLVCE